MKRVINVITFIYIALFLAVLLMSAFGYKQFNILSDSMSPSMVKGDTVLVNVRDTDVEKSDIIAFNMGDVIVIHRVTDVRDGEIFTKGDANETEDPGSRSLDSVVGTFVINLGFIGSIINMLTVKFRYAMIIVLFVLNIVVDKGPKQEN